jgi:hypothetical protein
MKEEGVGRTFGRTIGFTILLGIALYLLLVLHKTPQQIIVLFAIALLASILTSRLQAAFRSHWNTGLILRMRNSELIANIRELLPSNMLIFLPVFAVEVYLVGLAYAVTLAYPGNGAIVYQIVSVLVTIEGLLLGLLSLSVFTANQADRRAPPYLAVLTIFSVLFSLATIMLAELSAQLVSWVLPAFFLSDVFVFVLVGAAYSWFLVKRHEMPKRDVRQ